jgi:hypothetical protein
MLYFDVNIFAVWASYCHALILPTIWWRNGRGMHASRRTSVQSPGLICCYSVPRATVWEPYCLADVVCIGNNLCGNVPSPNPLLKHTDCPQECGRGMVSNFYKYLHNLEVKGRMAINGRNRSRVHIYVLACSVTVGRLNFCWSSPAQ